MAATKQGLPGTAAVKSAARKKSRKSMRSRPRSKDVEAPRPTRDRFEISVHLHEGTYVGKIWHPFSKKTEQLKSLNGTDIVRFISECLPSPAAERPEVPESPRPARAAAGVLRDLEIYQGERHESIDTAVVEPGKPFSVLARIALGSPPGERIPHHVAEYSVSLIARRPRKVGMVAEGMAVEGLSPGQADYESRIEMPPLRQGAYVLDVFTRVPLASVAESERVPLQVG